MIVSVPSAEISGMCVWKPLIVVWRVEALCSKIGEATANNLLIIAYYQDLSTSTEAISFMNDTGSIYGRKSEAIAKHISEDLRERMKNSIDVSNNMQKIVWRIHHNWGCQMKQRRYENPTTFPWSR